MAEQAHDAHVHGGLQHHFDDLAQQHEASTIGMWTFLITEVMFFGGLFLAYIFVRTYYGHAFAAASHELDWKLGFLNTLVLLTSSLTMAFAVRSAQLGRSKLIVRYLIATIGLGLVFLGIKAFEYYVKYEHGLIPGLHWQPHELHDPAAQAYFFLYFAMTGVHALHMIIGIGIVSVIAWMARSGRFDENYYNPVEVTGLYWHFVDIVWIFLYPLLYLVDPHFK